VKSGWPYPRRIELIEKLNKRQNGPTSQVPFQGAVLNLPIQHVPINMPKYRLNNGRTEHAQKEYIATHDGTPDDFFTRDHESEEVETVQHQLLEAMVNEQGLLDYFRKHVQEMPLILTADGFVLNGNRRLCAYRTLLESDAKAFEHFQSLQVVVLPPADERDLDRLESRLQREPDIRARYSWIADAVKYRKRLLSKEFSLDELSALEDVDKELITQYVSMLGYAEEYLKYRGTPYQYRLLSSGAGGGDSKYAFEQLVKFRGKIKGSERQEIFTNLVFAAMLDPHGSMYKSIPLMAEHFDHIVANLPSIHDQPEPPGGVLDGEPATPQPGPEGHAKDRKGGEGGESPSSVSPLLSPAVVPSNEQSSQKARLAEILGPGKASAMLGLVQATSSVDNATSIRTAAEEVVDELESFKKEKKKKNFVYAQILKANTALKEARNAVSSSTSKTGVAAQLTEASSTIADLMAWVTSKP
jgi:hypothetical protein